LFAIHAVFNLALSAATSYLSSHRKTENQDCRWRGCRCVTKATRSHLFGMTALPSAATHVAKVRKLFPDRSEDVSRLALRNETFRSLCEEYGLASDALDLLEAMNRPQDVEKRHEYRTIINDLQKELKYELLASHGHDAPQKK
jgi:hypothetical protein